MKWYFQVSNLTYVFSWQLGICSYILFQSLGSVQFHCILALVFTFGQFPHISVGSTCAVVFAIQIFYLRIYMAVECCRCILFQTVGTVQLHCFLALLFTFCAISTDFSCNLLEFRLVNLFLLWQALRSSGAMFPWGHLGACNFGANLLQMFLMYSVQISIFMVILRATWAFGFCKDEMACEYSNSILHIPYFVLAVPWGDQGFTCLFLACWMTSYQMSIFRCQCQWNAPPKRGFDHQPIQRLKKGRSAFAEVSTCV